MDQIKLTPGKLLNVYGNLNEAGYATSLVKEYHRHDIKAKKLRIKVSVSQLPTSMVNMSY